MGKQLVVFARTWNAVGGGGHNSGELAGFEAEEAGSLINNGIAREPTRAELQAAYSSSPTGFAQLYPVLAAEFAAAASAPPPPPAAPPAPAKDEPPAKPAKK